MTLTDRLTRAPLALEPDLAADVEGIAPAAWPLVEGMCGSSSYLRGLVQREIDWFRMALDADPDASFAGLLVDMPEDPQALGTALRRAKRRAALLLAACDLGGVWTLEEVTGSLTRFADAVTGLALDAEVRRLAQRGKLPGVARDADAAQAGLVVLAMGKMGAFELNYSSDIDLIMLFDDARADDDDLDTLRAGFQKVTRGMTKLLSEQTAEGYVFRTDLRLRPNPSVTPVCVPMEAAERYYEAEGRTWERAAFIKARAAAGDLAAGRGLLDRLTPFVWRRHLDFNAIRDAHDMRLAIRKHKGTGGRIAVPGHDIKLGAGGIREIEFFAQTQQLIAGGRDPSLRAPGTVAALMALANAGWVPEEIATRLIADYRVHRQTEHRIQMLRDAQTHQMPAAGSALDQVARLSGWGDTGEFVAAQKDRLEEVNRLIEGFFAPTKPAQAGPDLPADMEATMDSWVGLPALRSRRAMDIFDRLRPEIARRLADATQPETTLRQLDAFLRGLPAGVQLFAMFEANPHILDLLLDICGTAPSLAAHLSRNSAVLDAVITGRFFDPLPDAAGFLDSLHAALGETEDYEEALSTARRWQREQHFRIGVLQLRQLSGLEEVEAGYSDLAEAVLRGLLPFVEAEVARRYGRFARQGVAVLGMGKLGSRQMTATSDLDLIVIYECEGEFADGRQGFAPQQYFARLTQTLITALSTAMADGRLYEVDMRLRPSGRQGPVAVSLAGFTAYQKTDAWTWEHLALTRARVVAGAPELGTRLEAVRRDVIASPRDRAAALADVRDMRRRLSEAKGARAGVWEVKDRTGGILDIELAAQAVALLSHGEERDPRAQLSRAAEARAIDWQAARLLVQAHMLLCAVQQAQRLLVDGIFEPDKLGADGMRFVARFAGATTPEGLLERIDKDVDTADRLVRRILAQE